MTSALVFRAFVLRPVFRRPARFLATVAGVAAGVGAVVATVLASRAAVSSLAEGVAEISGATVLEISRPGGLESAALAALRDLSDEALFVPVVEEIARVPGRAETLRVLATDLLLPGAERESVRVDPAPLERARSFSLTVTGDGAIVPAWLARELGKRPGDRLALLARARAVEVTVAAVHEPLRLGSVFDRIVVMDVALAQELFALGDRLDRIDVRPRRGGPSPERDALAARIAERLPPGCRVARPEERAERTRDLVRALDFNLAALSGISILVGIVLVATTLATSVVQRRYAISLLRSLGASRARIAGAVLSEAAAIGAAGGALGVLGGWAGARAALAGVRRTVATVVGEAIPAAPRLDLGLAALGLLLGLGASLAAAGLPLREALRTPPIQGLREERPGGPILGFGRRLAALLALVASAWGLTRLPPLGERPVAALGASLLLLTTVLVLSSPIVSLLSRLRFRRGARLGPLRVAQAGLAAGHARAAWAAGAVGIAVSLAVAMTVMVGSFRATVVDWASQAMRSDLFLRPLPNESGVPVGRLDPEIVAAAVRLFGEDAVDPYHSSRARFRGEEIPLAGAALDVVGREGGVPFRDGRPSKEVLSEAARRRGAIVNEPFARRFGVGEGDRITLSTRAGEVEREVIGVFRDYTSHLGRVILSRPDFLGIYPDEGPSSVAIYLEPGADAAAARDRLLRELGGAFAFETFLEGEIRREILAIFDRTFAVTTALKLVASLVAVIAVLTVLFALVSERRRDLGVLRVLGASPAQVRGVVLGEAFLLAVAGAAQGTVVGLAVGYVLVTVVNVQSFGWTILFLPPWGSVAATALAVIPFGAAAGLLPARLAARTTPREVLHEDG